MLVIVRNLAFYLYYIVLALWVGGIAVFTFVITPVIFNSYNRDMAGEIVGRLFPGYFLYNLVLSLLALVFYFIHWSDIAIGAFRLSLGCIVIAIAINIFVSFSLHPQIKAIKKEIHSFETVSSFDPLRVKFRRLHGVSAVLNLLLLADGVTLLVIGTMIKK